MCVLAVTVELYRAAISVSYVDTHSFTKQKHTCWRNSLIGCTTAQMCVCVCIYIYIHTHNIGLLKEK